MLSEALEAARGAIGFNGAEALIEFAPHVPEVLSEALALTRGIGDKSKRAKVLGRLAPYLPESLLPEALEIARAIGDEYERASALTGLASHLPESLLSEALEIARGIDYKSYRASALIGLASYLGLAEKVKKRKKCGLGKYGLKKHR